MQPTCRLVGRGAIGLCAAQAGEGVAAGQACFHQNVGCKARTSGLGVVGLVAGTRAHPFTIPRMVLLGPAMMGTVNGCDGRNRGDFVPIRDKTNARRGLNHAHADRVACRVPRGVSGPEMGPGVKKTRSRDAAG